MLYGIGVLCYDDGCHLKKYVEKRKDLTETAKQLASYQIVVDKMHFRGHVDKWCQENCNPYKLHALDNVSMHVGKSFTHYLSEPRHVILISYIHAILPYLAKEHLCKIEP